MAVTSCDFCFHYTATPGKAQPLGAAWTAPSLCLHSQKSAPESGHLAQIPALSCGRDAFSAVSAVYVDFHAQKKGPDGWKIMAKVFTEA